MKRILLLVLCICCFAYIGISATQAQAAWAPNTAYKTGDLVTYNGLVYKCIQGHTSQVGWEPPNVPALWGVQTGTTAPTNTATATKTNTAVATNTSTTAPTRTNTPGGPTATRTSTSVPTNTSVATNTSTIAPTATTGSGIPAWTIGVTYKIGDLVTYNGIVYQCINGNTAIAGWEPPNVPALWKVAPNTPTPTYTATFVPPTYTPSKTYTPGGPTITPTPLPKLFVGYAAEWATYVRNFQIWQIPPTLYNVINYAFSDLDASGNCYSYDTFADFQKNTGNGDVQPLEGNIGQLKILKQKNPNLKIMISVGGWTLSNNFSAVASTDAGRKQLASSCINLWIKGIGMQGNGAVDPSISAGIFDGIDIDWEYPGSAGNTTNFTAADKGNFTLLMQEIRNELNTLSATTGKKYLLTAAMNIDPTKMSAGYDLPSLTPLVDWFDLMTYDFHGGWDAAGPTNFNGSLYASPNDPSPAPQNTTWNGDSAVTRYLAAGVPKDKIVFGVPFYGRGWGNVGSTNNGLYQTAAAPLPLGTFGNVDSTAAGVWSYWDLKANYLSSYGNFTDSASGSPWLYSASAKVFITYESTTSAGNKANYIVSKGLRGAMAWEIDDDDHSSFDLAHSICTKIGSGC